jgi:hypothetical protein
MEARLVFVEERNGRAVASRQCQSQISENLGAVKAVKMSISMSLPNVLASSNQSNQLRADAHRLLALCVGMFAWPGGTMAIAVMRGGLFHSVAVRRQRSHLVIAGVTYAAAAGDVGVSWASVQRVPWPLGADSS